MPNILSSFRTLPGGHVEEVTWTPEDVVLSRLKYNLRDPEHRLALRAFARAGGILHRRNPEYGFWEYGPAWRVKGFRIP